MLARTYDSTTGARGRLLSDETRTGAAGGLYLTPKGLARFAAALLDNNFLSPDRRALMINDGPRGDLLGFNKTTIFETHDGRVFSHNGVRKEGTFQSLASLMIFPNRCSTIFVTNSPWAGVGVEATLVAAYDDATFNAEVGRPVADYVTFSDASFDLGGDGPHTKTLAEHLAGPEFGEGAIVMYSRRRERSGAVGYEIQVNGSTISQTSVNQTDWHTLHEVIPTGILQHGKNEIEFRVTSGSGLVSVGDVALFYRRDPTPIAE